MTVAGWLEIALFAAVVGLLTHPLGGYLTRVYAGERTFLQPLLRPVEAALYRLAGVDPEAEQNWYRYTASLLLFHLFGTIALYALLRLQSALPLNPQNFPAVAPDLALNTAVSFVTNTSWQSYAGETTLSYLSQMAGVTVASTGTMPTDNALFGWLLLGVILVVGGLIYFPALTLAPILEQLSGR